MNYRRASSLHEDRCIYHCLALRLVEAAKDRMLTLTVSRISNSVEWESDLRRPKARRKHRRVQQTNAEPAAQSAPFSVSSVTCCSLQ